VEDPAECADVKYVRAVRAKVTPAVEEHPARSALNQKLDRPQRSKRQETCLAGWIRVNGVDAFTLFDSGSNTDTLSPAFAQVSDTQTRKLDQQVPLQLGTVGSRAAINYGAQVPIELGDVRHPEYYFDIVNIDRYDCIAGAPMMRQFGIRLDFREDAIFVGEQRIRANVLPSTCSFSLNVAPFLVSPLMLPRTRSSQTRADTCPTPPARPMGTHLICVHATVLMEIVILLL